MERQRCAAMTESDRRAGLAALTAGGAATTAAVLAFFDPLPPVRLDQMLGTWRGEGLASGHPMDGLLERFGWYGKRFDGPDDVQPLLVRDRRGIFPVDPAFVPMGLVVRRPGLVGHRLAARAFSVCGRLARAHGPTARLRMMEYRDVLSATMIYDRQPILDAFRAVDAGTLLGAMDLRGTAQPFFFVLRSDAGTGTPPRCAPRKSNG